MGRVDCIEYITQKGSKSDKLLLDIKYLSFSRELKTYTAYSLAEQVTAKGLVVRNYSAELTVRINTSIFSKLEVKNDRSDVKGTGNRREKREGGSQALLFTTLG